MSCCALAAMVAAACIHPKDDYDDWLARTADARAARPTIDAGAFEAGPLDTPFEHDYFMACLPALASGDATKALLFQSHVKFTPSAGGGGTLDFTNTPLRAKTTDFTATVGDVAAVTGSAVTADGHADVVFGATTIPAAANAATGTDVMFQDSTLHLLIGNDSAFCASLSGDIVKPTPITLDASENFCRLVVHAGDKGSGQPLPSFAAGDFHCP